jgi:UDP-N-acetyl-D-mannosaminuronate dehydrogenase
VPELIRQKLSSTPLDQTLRDADVVVLVTAHPEVDHDAIAREAKLFVDLRGATRGAEAANIVRL